MFRRVFQQVIAFIASLTVASLAGEAKSLPFGPLPPRPPLSQFPVPREGGVGREGHFDLGEQSYRIRRWTAEDGLPQNTVKTLTQTRDGYLWLGTLNGLARFDGVRFKIFDHSNTPEMTRDSIDWLVEDKEDGSVWVNAGATLLCYHDHCFKRYGPEQGVQNVIGPLWPALQGGVWFSPRSGILGLARDGQVKLWEFGPDAEGYRVNHLAEARPSQIVLLIGSILYQADFNAKSMERVSVPAEAPYCHSFFQDAKGALWVYGDKGIWRRNDGQWQRIVSRNAASSLLPGQIYQTSDGQIWVTQREADRTSLEIQRLIDGQLRPFAIEGLKDDLTVNRVLNDRENNLWIGTTMGLLRLQPKNLKVYSREDRLASDDTVAVTEAADGTIWVGTDAGISAIREGKVQNLTLPELGESRRKIAVFLADRRNGLVIPGEKGLLRRSETGRWQKISVSPELKNPLYLKSLYEDRQGRLWIGTGDGVFWQERSRWNYLSITNGLSYPDVRLIYQDRKGDMWFGTYGGGLNRLHEGKLTSYSTTRGYYNNRAWWIHEDADGVFWLGSEDGLNRFENGQFFTFTTQQGLGENVINNIQEDDFGYLWLSGLHGIYRIARQQLNEVARGQRAQVECMAFGEADGMLNSECNGGDNQPSGCKDREGKIWFPTAQGVVVIDPKQIHRNKVPPPVVIEQVLDDKDVIRSGT